MKMIKLSAEG